MIQGGLRKVIKKLLILTFSGMLQLHKIEFCLYILLAFKSNFEDNILNSELQMKLCHFESS